MHDPAAKSTLCLIRDALTGNRISLRVRPADTVNSLYEAVRLNMDRSKDTIQLLLAPSAPAGLPKAPPVQYNEDQLIALPDSDRHTLAQIGVDFAPTRQHTVIMRDAPPAAADDLASPIVAADAAANSPTNNTTNISGGTSNSNTSTVAHSPSSMVFDKLSATSPPAGLAAMELHLQTSSPTFRSPAAASTSTNTSTSTTTSTTTITAASGKASVSPSAVAAALGSATAVAAAPTTAGTATICAPPPPPPNSSSRHNGSGNSDDVMDVDQDHLPAGPSSAGAETRSPPSGTSSSGSGMLMLYSPPPPSEQRYVGLVNQAMTCYLNSLLQALFMTPEFRNAMYKWEYTAESDSRRKSIPFELQKLFLLLQTSTRSAVETTNLTISFGWESCDAWQQHDVQELCRVMFDALESKFKRTAQADLINRLYEGKMIDYVRCLKCQTEKQREDSFLDIPLPVRPFGSTVAYESIEEALRGFVEAERLEDTNQYFCEKCNCKCDARKGLKFARFPYILTLHLKRFDFDYQTFHRIKLNDKVTFPQTLNLNHFVKESDMYSAASAASAKCSVDAAAGQPVHTLTNGGSATSEHGSVESAIKGDDCSTTDSDCGVLDDELAAISSSSPNNNNNNNINNNITNNNNNNNNNAIGTSGGGATDSDLMPMQEDDEGIDVTSTTDTKSSISTMSASGATATSSTAAGAAIIAANESGPYIYELFAIMIHSGSASGGHYYAYIKEFESCEWFCFNDTSVTPATQEDINRSFGGGSNGTKSYYSGAFTSSTNAYMLMYRQLDPQRNVTPMKPAEFPPHIQQLMQRLHDKKEADRYAREQDEVRMKFTVFWRHPQDRQLRDKRISMNVSQTLEDTLAEAHDRLDFGQFAPISRCRLVGFDSRGGELVTHSYEGKERQPLGQSLAQQLLDRGSTAPIEFLLETRRNCDDRFEPIQPGSIGTLVYRVTDLINGDVDDESVLEVRTMGKATVGEYKALVARKLRVDVGRLVVVLLTANTLTNVLDIDEHRIDLMDMSNKSKVFVAMADDAVPDGLTVPQRLAQIVERFESILTLFFLLPNTDKETLEKMDIPPYKEPIPAASPSAKGSPSSYDRCADVTMSSTPSPTRPITIVTSAAGQWNATCDVDVVDAHMTVAPALHHSMQHNMTSYTMKLPGTPAAAAFAAITTTATVTLPLGRSNGIGAPSAATTTTTSATGVEQPESNSEDSSLSDSDRTLVDDSGAVGDLADLSSTNNSPACSDTQLSSPEYLSRRINDFCDDDDDDESNACGTNGGGGGSGGGGDHDDDEPATLKMRKYYFRATLLDDEAAAALAAAAALSSSSSSSVANTTHYNGSSSNSSTTGEYGPKQQQQRTLKVKVDQSMILGSLKQALERHVCVSKDYLKIFRQSKSPEWECTSPRQSLQALKFTEGERLVIELGRALRKGEHKCKVFFMRLADCIAPDFKTLQPVCDYILCAGADVGSTKREIIAQLASTDPKYSSLAFESCRLRMKSCRSPMDVYTDEQKFGDNVQISPEYILQECDEASQPYTNPDDKIMFIRRWNPSSYTLSPMQEIVIAYEGHFDLRDLIANVSSIAAEDIEYCKVTGTFPKFNIALMSVHANSSWTDRPLFTDDMALSSVRSGGMYLYRDKNEALKELTVEERRAIHRSDNDSSTSAYGSMSSYSSPRREQGLKIYLDPSPKKTDSFDLMN